jgi:hypothetical protein
LFQNGYEKEHQFWDPEIVAAVEKRENHFDFHQVSSLGFLLCISDDLTSNFYLPEIFRGLTQYSQAGA